MAKNLRQELSELEQWRSEMRAQCARSNDPPSDTPRSDHVAVEFDPLNNFCFVPGSKWVPLEDARNIERTSSRMERRNEQRKVS